MSNKNQYTAKDFIDAIPGSGGIVSTIAARVGCKWHTAKKYIDTMATVQQAYQDEIELLKDDAESVVATNIRLAKKEQARGRMADSADAKWYLTRKGKDRGYVERQERTGKDGEPLEIKFTWEDAEDL